MAFSTLYDLKIDKNRLVEYMAEGEVASAGTKHYDNVSASLLGGFVVCRIASDRLQSTRLEPPKDLVLVIAVPWLEVPKKKTEVARSVLPKVALKDVVHNISGASTIVAGFALKDVETITKGIDDAIIEPARKHLIPGYDSVKQNAISAGPCSHNKRCWAFHDSISENKQKCRGCSRHGQRVQKTGIESKTFVCRASKGARLLA